MLSDGVTRIPAKELRGIALIAIESLKDPANFTIDMVATDKNGNAVTVFNPSASIFDPVGHVLRAATRFYNTKIGLKSFVFTSSNQEMLHAPSSKASIKINAALNQLDAQVRYIDRAERVGNKSSYYRGIVSIGHEPCGREMLLRLLELAATRLEEGDSMLVSPHDVGVSHDLPEKVEDDDELEAVELAD
jgi:hypothetical protein